MKITNGTVSRAFKPEDYGTRTVGLSFAIDEGDDFAAVVAKVGKACEHFARNGFDAPMAADTAAPARQTRAKPVETQARVEEASPPAAANPTAATTDSSASDTSAEVAGPASATDASASTPASDTTAPPASETSAETASSATAAPVEITTADLNAAINQAHHRLAQNYPELAGQENVNARGQVIRGLRDKIMGVVGMSVMQMTQPQRQQFLAELLTLKP